MRTNRRHGLRARGRAAQLVGLDDLRAAGMADGTWPAEPIPPRNPNLEGRARMAEVRRAAGIPLTADDLEALKSSIRPRAVAS